MIDDAVATVSSLRAYLGAIENRFEHTIRNLTTTMENTAASVSRISDADMAQEMTSFTRAQIMSQAGTAMLSQATRAPQGLLALLT
jgi:flagellin